MKKPHLNIVHYMSKTADLDHGGVIQNLLVEFVVASISITLTLYGYFNQWDLLIPIFILPAILGTLAFLHTLYLIISDWLSPNNTNEDENND